MKKNPKIDLVFKKLFGSEENKDILMSLINAILPTNKQIVDLILKNPYNVSDYAEGKLSILDIKAEDQNGVLYDIEMQIKGSDFYGRRTLYYWAKMFGSQLDYTDKIPTAGEQIEELAKLAKLGKRGKISYSGLKKCIVISLMDFEFFKDDRYQRYYTLKDGETHEIHRDLDYLYLYFIELKKFEGEFKTVKTVLERWITFLNNSYKYSKDNLPKELSEIEEINQANHRLEKMYLDEQEKGYYDAQHKYWLDEISRAEEIAEKNTELEIKGAEIAEKNAELEIKVEIAEKSAELEIKVAKIMEMAEKIEEVTKALADKEFNKSVEFAKKMLKRGIAIEIIAEDTGLTIEQLQNLQSIN